MHRRNHVKQKTIGVDTSANIRLCKSRRKLPRHAVSLIFPCDIMWEVSDHNVYMFKNTYWQLFLYRYMTWYSPSMVTNCNNNLIKKNNNCQASDIFRTIFRCIPACSYLSITLRIGKISPEGKRWTVCAEVKNIIKLKNHSCVYTICIPSEIKSSFSHSVFCKFILKSRWHE